MHRSAVLLLTVWGIWAASGLARADTGPASAAGAEDLVRRFESSYRGVKTLRAEFTQSHSWGGRTRVESGTVYFTRGGLMRWDYRQPDEKLFLAKRNKLLLYVPAEKQLTVSPLKSSEDVRVPFRLLLSRLDLRRVFSKIELADQQVPHESGDHVLRGFPKPEYQEDYRDVLIEVSPSFDVRRLVITYPDQSVVEFRFDHIERNVALEPGLFHFSPPPGTEVIEH